MKVITFAFVFCLMVPKVKSQNGEIEKSIFGIQAGYLGAWIYGDVKLSEDFLLRSEIGFDSGIKSANFQYNTGIAITPAITLEPRWYYKMSKRESDSKNKANNLGNFLAVKTTFRPNLIIKSGDNSNHENSSVSIIPTWGIRRNIKNKFNYEMGIGLGYNHNFIAENRNKNTSILNVHLRVGFML